MDYEKKYKTLLKQAKEELRTCGSLDCDAAKQIFRFFPELKESEESEDERIRKNTVNLIKDVMVGKVMPLPLSIYKESISWLEKQGTTFTKKDVDDAWLQGMCDAKRELEKQDEQMIAKGERKNVALSIIHYLDDNRVAGCMDLSSMECEDIEDACVNSKWTKLYNYMKKKLEKQDTPKDYRSIDPYFFKPIETKSKFKVGDWIAADRTNFRSPIKIVDISDTEYRTEDTKGNSGVSDIDYLDSRFHLWSIDDAKDGDVLVDVYGSIGIYHQKGEFDWMSYCSTGRYSGRFQSFIQNHYVEGTLPANTDQCNLLFQKMGEAGYMWDSYTKSVFCMRNSND